MPPGYCPNCEEAINADNDATHCDYCRTDGCEDCLGDCDGGACWTCLDSDVDDEDEMED
jgi:hypothetical protein